MSRLARIAAVVLGVMVLAVVLAVCGEGACEACIHVCCARSDRADRMRSLVREVLNTQSVRVLASADAIDDTGLDVRDARPLFACAPGCLGRSSLLRI